MEDLPTSSTEKSIDLIAAGNLTPLKNHSLFIEIVHSLITDYPNLNALILGEGVLFDELNQKIKQLGLTQNIIVLGKQSR